jgi:hypothetical protein
VPYKPVTIMQNTETGRELIPESRRQLPQAVLLNVSTPEVDPIVKTKKSDN